MPKALLSFSQKRLKPDTAMAPDSPGTLVISFLAKAHNRTNPPKKGQRLPNTV